MFVRGYDMPRTKAGIPVDMIMNPHAIPSRMTVAQLIEALIGKAAPQLGTVANGTLFMNDGSPVEAISKVLRDDLGMEPFGEELMYDGMGGNMIPTKMFLGNVFTMRLKHMPEDKWNARGEGRREQRTHQPTGGRGAQGGLRIGEMERDAILGHGIADFLRESIMKRADGYQTVVCNGCGTIPIYNEREKLYICSMCDGPVKYIGENANNLEILPATRRSVVSFSKVEIPYAFKLLDQELNTYLNMGLRVLTDKDLTKFRPPKIEDITAEQAQALLAAPLPERVLPEVLIPEYIPPVAEPEVRPEDLAALGATEEEEKIPAEAPAAAPAVPVPAPAANNQGGVVLQLGNMNVRMPQQEEASPAAAGQQGGGGGGLDDSDNDDIPFAPAESAPVKQSNSVTVQTTNQPVLVVPLSMNQAPAPTEVIAPPAPGAPNTIAVDTSPNAMKTVVSSNSRPGTPNNRSRSNSNGSANSAAATARVTVNKVGGGATPAPAANVRVSVNKIG
jgi:hypothetical protein